MLRVLPKPSAFNRAANPGEGLRGCAGCAGDEVGMAAAVVEGVVIVRELWFAGDFGVALLDRPAVWWRLLPGARAVSVLCELEGSWKVSSAKAVNVSTGS